MGLLRALDQTGAVAATALMMLTGRAIGMEFILKVSADGKGRSLPDHVSHGPRRDRRRFFLAPDGRSVAGAAVCREPAIAARIEDGEASRRACVRVLLPVELGVSALRGLSNVKRSAGARH